MTPQPRARGTKRICQSATCGLPFYDLNRAESSCPTCGTPFELKVATQPANASATTTPWKRNSRTFQRAAVAPIVAPAELPDEDVEVEVEADDDSGSALILEEEEEESAEVGSVIKPIADDRGDA
jgi:hypothetical protein